MQSEKITINNTSYNVRFSLRAIKLFEELAGKSIQQMQGTWDASIYFYATLKALNTDFEMSFDEFIDYLDTHTDLLIEWQTLNVSEPATDENASPIKKNKLSNNLSMLWMLSLLLFVCTVAAPVIFGIGLLPMSLWGITKLITSIGKKPKP